MMTGVTRVLSAFLIGAGLLAEIALMGCARTSKPPENKAADNLRKISQAYDIAMYKNRHPPQDAEELKPFLKEVSQQEDPDAILVSPNDHQPYEIVWGVNLDKATEINAILAHEKQGIDGQRFVITVARITKQVSDADFKSASFAKGKKLVKKN